MDRRATHRIRLLIAAAIVAVAAPIAQAGSRGQQASAQPSDPGQAAYTAAWQAYRGLPGGLSVATRFSYPQLKTGQGFSFAAPNGWPTVQAAPAFAPLRVGTGFSFAAPTGWTRATPVPTSGSGGFNWGDAGIGAAGMFGVVLLVGGVGAVLIAARNRRQPRHA